MTPVRVQHKYAYLKMNLGLTTGAGYGYGRLRGSMGMGYSVHKDSHVFLWVWGSRATNGLDMARKHGLEST